MYNWIFRCSSRNTYMHWFCRNKGTVSLEYKYSGFCSIYLNHVSEHLIHSYFLTFKDFSVLPRSAKLGVYVHIIPKGLCEDCGISCICSFQFHLIKVMWWVVTGRNILMGLPIYLLILCMLSLLIVPKGQYRYISSEGHPYKYYSHLESPFLHYIWKYAYKEPVA